MTKKEKIEKKYEELEKYVKQFEEGKVGVEESIEMYTNAKKMVAEIRKELEGLELKIEEK